MHAREKPYCVPWRNPNCHSPAADQRYVAIIGCGNYAFTTLAHYLYKAEPAFLQATYDVNSTRAISLCRHYGGAYCAANWGEIIDDERVKLVFIASNHASHAEYAIACIEADKHVHIEKPHVVNKEQLDRLALAMERHPAAKVFLGFNRPRSTLFKRLDEVLDGENGSLMINWFIAGHDIPEDHWYFDPLEGGRVLGNLSHWTDLTLHLVGVERAFPLTVIPACPMPAKSDFVVSIKFADGSCATMTFSAKGATFEGVREVLNVHKGDVIGTLIDFQRMTYDVADRRVSCALWFRDHGHKANILHSLRAVSDDTVHGAPLSYICATARLFLAAREAVETGQEVVLR